MSPRILPIVKKKTITVEVPVGTGDIDVLYKDGFDISEQLAGTLGPVQTQDTIDISEALAAGPWSVDDTVNLIDVLGPQDGPQIADGIEISEALSGVLGPIRAPDTVDITDDPVLEALTLQDSLSVSDEHDVDLVAAAPDSVDISDVLGQIIKVADDDLYVADTLAPADLTVADSLDCSDLFDLGLLTTSDSLDFADEAPTAIAASQPDSFELTVDLIPPVATAVESVDLSEVLQDLAVSNASMYANALVGTPAVFTATGNFIDNSPTTESVASIAQSGGLGGGAQSASPSIRVSFGNPNVSFTPLTLGTVTLEYDWTTDNAGVALTTAATVNMVPAYSLNNGGSWTNLTAVTNAAGTATVSQPISMTWAQLQAFEFRWTGTITSGAVAILGGAQENFRIRYARLIFSLTVP